MLYARENLTVATFQGIDGNIALFDVPDDPAEGPQTPDLPVLDLGDFGEKETPANGQPDGGMHVVARLGKRI
jgi:hypothetical protein